jgi:hypothetical protein
MTITVADAIDIYGVTIHDHLPTDVTIPVLTGPQCQGDVSVLPVTTTHPGVSLPAAGIPVVRGEAGGNTHTLIGPDTVTWAPHDGSADSLTLGHVTVPHGAVAYLAHPEHSYTGIGPGTYRVGRQREWAGEWRTVAD